MIEVSLNLKTGGFALDASFSLPSSGITVLWGRSGAGKTSLLRAIAGLDRARGRVVLDGEVWQDERRFLAVHRRRLGYVFQEPSLLPHLTVRGNLDYAAHRHPGASFDDIVQSLSIAGLLDRAADKLSGGERQRVAIARALLGQPRLLLMDEPLSSLDATARSELLPLIRDLAKSQARPVLYVTHDPAEATAIADRVLIIADGRVTVSEAHDVSLDGRSQAEIEALARSALRLGL